MNPFFRFPATIDDDDIPAIVERNVDVIDNLVRVIRRQDEYLRRVAQELEETRLENRRIVESFDELRTHVVTMLGSNGGCGNNGDDKCPKITTREETRKSLPSELSRTGSDPLERLSVCPCLTDSHENKMFSESLAREIIFLKEEIKGLKTRQSMTSKKLDIVIEELLETSECSEQENVDYRPIDETKVRSSGNDLDDHQAERDRD